MSDNQPPTSGSLTYETAEEHALTRVPTASPSSPAGEIRKQLAQNTYDNLTHVAILEDTEKLVGVLTIEELFSAPGEAVVDIIRGQLRGYREEYCPELGSQPVVSLVAQRGRSMSEVHGEW
jgi:CBS domain-containing protein